ncbi:MAG: hypothetical protein ACREAK_05165 [Nitrosarchaeum sp.]
MNKKTSTIIVGTVTAILLIPGTSMVYAEFAPYLGNVGQKGQTGSYTLEEVLKLSQERVVKANENRGLGSGTPILALDGAIGASIVSAGVFGGIATAFFVKGKGGRYAAPGRG